ncbi:hypothetical protein NDU88_008062 [Pleurodeles waltl]|uniref:Secreted protein n=1 Tax=Pleurodeles waltl TaxID=8319 RepID=A0AAV7QMN1_PLEWA|nr:hypothetical protein NDU88_008062 [Pleurodeles waltl]
MRFRKDSAVPLCLLLRACRACGPKGEGAGMHLRAALGPGTPAGNHQSPGGPVAQALNEHRGRATKRACRASCGGGSPFMTG